MSDVGHTAPLSPNNSQESDMAKVREVFDRAVSAMIASTELAKEVSELRLAVNELKNDIEYVRSRNRELDTLLVDVRGQRDKALADLKQANDDLFAVNGKAHDFEHQANNLRNDVLELQSSLAQTKKDRDEAAFAALSLREDLDWANAKLKGIMDTLGVKVEEPKPIPQPEPQPEATQAQPKRRIYEGEEGYPYGSYLPGHEWDDIRHQYYIEAEA